MAKYLLLLLVIMIVMWGLMGRLRGPSRPPSTGGSGGRSPRDGVDEIVPCAHCGVHLPRSEALPGPPGDDAHHYCSAEHRRRGPGAGAV